MIKHASSIVFPAAMFIAISLTGCQSDPTKGYTTSSQYRSGIKSVAVPISTRGKDVYRRGLEMRLAEALVKRIELNTPYKVTARQRADTLLETNINEITQRALSLNPDTGLARELEITMVVSLTWTDLRTDKILKKIDNVRVSGVYIPEGAFQEDFFQGSQDVIERMAERVVEEMEAPW